MHYHTLVSILLPIPNTKHLNASTNFSRNNVFGYSQCIYVPYQVSNTSSALYLAEDISTTVPTCTYCLGWFC